MGRKLAMAVRIGSNISSLQAQRRLSEASSTLSKTYERLSSGQRINRASDDAAGLAIAEGLRVSSRVKTQGIRNLNDTVSYLTIAEGATRELTDIIMRAKELAEQSANGVYSGAQRSALDNELQTLGKEYNRIIESTSFNGRKIFERSASTLHTQAGDSVLTASLLSDAVSKVDEIERISVGLSGAEANGDSFAYGKVSTSADGRYVVFQSYASNLVSGDGNARSDIFVKDLQTGSISRVSTSSSGTEGNNDSSSASISADGRYVVFESNASNLVSDDGNGRSDIFLKDLQTGSLSRVSTSSLGAEGNSHCSSASISADGRYVVFESLASNLVSGDGNGALDIFVKDLQTGNLSRVSTSSLGIEGNNMSSSPSISADGRYVVFGSNASNLVSGDGNGTRDIFVKDLQTESLSRVSTSSSGAEGNGYSADASISADGRYLVFSSLASNLVSGDGNGMFDVFVKDLQTGNISRVSSSSSGAEGNNSSYNASINADGRYVVFQSSASNLVSGDGNGVFDIFVKDLQSGSIERLSVSQSGREALNSWDGTENTRPCISADGRYVIFISDMTDLLDGPETGTVYSVYATPNSLAFQSSLNPFQSESLNIRTQSSASSALARLNRSLEELSGYGGTLGSFTSRLDVAKSVLSSMNENDKAAESRIRDADIAEESAKLVRGRILQQVASAVLAQANQAPSVAIQLLK